MWLLNGENCMILASSFLTVTDGQAIDSLLSRSLAGLAMSYDVIFTVVMSR